MTARRSARPRSLALFLFLCLAVPAGLRAQSGPGWPPAMVGVRVGYLSRSATNATVLGAQLHIPVLPSGHVELVPNADITFFKGLKEYEYSVDAVFVSGGRRGGLVVGGGPAARNSIFPGSTTRETRKGWDVVAGLMFNPGEQLPVGIQIEERWTFFRVPVSPRVLSIGVNIPLWGWGSSGR